MIETLRTGSAPAVSMPTIAWQRSAQREEVKGSMGAMGRLAVLLAAAVLAACCAAPAFAHANLVSTSPQDGAVVASAPSDALPAFSPGRELEGELTSSPAPRCTR